MTNFYLHVIIKIRFETAFQNGVSNKITNIPERYNMKNPHISKRYWNSVSTPMGASSEFLDMYDDIINFSLGDPDITTDERIINKAFEDALNVTHIIQTFTDI